jgi:hypothetical protein
MGLTIKISKDGKMTPEKLEMMNSRQNKKILFVVLLGMLTEIKQVTYAIQCNDSSYLQVKQ